MRRHLIVTALTATLTAGVLGGCAAPATRYAGTYTRTWIGEDGYTHQSSGPVELALTNDGHYRLAGGSANLPPSREGRYRREGDLLVLVDTNAPAAGYDQSLIIEGPFSLAQDDGGMVLTQENLWGHSHLLILDVRPER